MPRLNLLLAVLLLTTSACSWGVDPDTIRCWSDEYCPDGFVCDGGGGAVGTSRGLCTEPESGADDDDATADDDDTTADDDDTTADDDDTTADDDDTTPADDDDDTTADDDDTTPADDDDATPPPLPEGTFSGECDDDEDNDGDLLYDCSDPDCDAAPNCPENLVTPCSPLAGFSCDEAERTIFYANGGPLGQDIVDTYCTSLIDMTGHEVDFVFVAPTDGDYTITVTGLQDDLDLFVLDDAAYQCVLTPCIDYSQSLGLADETSTFYALAGTRIHAVVDGWNGALSTFTITLLCP